MSRERERVKPSMRDYANEVDGYLHTSVETYDGDIISSSMIWRTNEGNFFFKNAKRAKSGNDSTRKASFFKQITTRSSRGLQSDEINMSQRKRSKNAFLVSGFFFFQNM